MEWITLKAELRNVKGSRACHQLRKKGLVPAILYGRKEPEQSLVIQEKEILNALDKGVRLVNLTLPETTEKVFVREAQYDHLQENLLHIDFNRLAMDETISLDIEITLKGQPKGVTADGGILEQNLRHLIVKCLPTAVPDKLELDVADLELDSLIRVKDLTLPHGVSTEADPEVVVVGVHMPREEVVVTAPPEAGAAEPEVITEKKEEEKEQAEEPSKAPKEEKKAPKEEKKGK